MRAVYKDWKDLNSEERAEVYEAFVNTEERNESDRDAPREEDVKDYYDDNPEKFGFKKKIIDGKAVLKKMSMRIFAVGEDEKCGGCNWVADRVFLMAETEEQAQKLYKENDRGLCAECLVEVMMEREYEIREGRNILQTREPICLVTEETIEGQILHGASRRGDDAILDLVDDIWSDTFYDRIYETIAEMNEATKKKLYAKYTGDKSDEN